MKIMGESTVRTKSKSKSRSQHTASDSRTAVHHNQNLSSFYSAGPALRLVQRNVAIGKSGDPYEKEADAVSKKVVAGEPAPQISRMPEGAIGREEIKKPEETTKAVQKQEIKKPEETVKSIQKEEIKKPEETAKPIQKEEIRKPENPTKIIQKDELKRPEKTVKSIQKEEIKKPEETAKPIQKEEIKKPEEVTKTVQKEEIKKPEEATKTLQKQEEETAQAKEGSSGSKSSSMESAASHAINTKGPGQPLSPSTQDALESKMGTDFSNVRVHNDSAANEAASALNARAFTHKNDIWLGKGESQNDLGLMAHEATHVVQQGGSIHRMVQRKPKKDSSCDKRGQGKGPILDSKSDPPFIIIPTLEIPEFKHELLGGKDKDVEIKRGTKRPTGKDNQRIVWGENVRNVVRGALPKKLEDKVKKDLKKKEPVMEGKDKIHFFRIGEENNYLVGKADELMESFVFPRWDKLGKPRLHDVDHKREVQLGGDPGIDNLHLLDASANRSSGATINKIISDSIENAAKELRCDPKYKNEKIPQTSDGVKKKYTIRYTKVLGSVENNPKGYNLRWDKKEVTQIDGDESPLSKLKAIGREEAEEKHLIGDSKHLTIYPLPSGGKPRVLGKGEGKKYNHEGMGIKGFTATSVEYDHKNGEGTIEGKVQTERMKNKGLKPKKMKMTLTEFGGIPYTACIDSKSLYASMRFAEFHMLSPIEFQNCTIDDERGLLAEGNLKTSVFRKNLELDIIFEGGDLWISKTFTESDFGIPGPLKITESSLTLAVSPSAGYKVEGDVFIEIEKVGKGQIAAVKDSEEFELKGEFNFDTKLFDPAKITLGYKKGKSSEGEFSGEGKIGIKEGKVKGIKSAEATVSYKEGRFEANGTVKPDVPGVEQGDIKLVYSEAEGLLIGGSLQFKKIKGLKGGKLDAKAVKKAGEENYRLSAQGQLESDVPGISATLNATYDDGAFDANVTTAYEKGMLKGTVTAGATNRPVDKDGKPAGAPGKHSDNITIYGGGSATVRISPWLQGTAGMKLLPNGEVEIVGAIGLPDALELFPEKKLEKNLFKIGVDIPIVGFAVAGQRVGIFANISGGLDLGAGIGPGQLRDLGLAVKYNPSHEEETHVKGGAKLFIPARAGVRLFVRGALGAGIPVVSAQAGLEIGGALGIEAAVAAGVQVDWTPAKGLVLDALAEAHAEPKFKFDITGFLLVEANLVFTSMELYNKRWQLAAVEYGSGLRFGIKLPIHYEEKGQFDLSMDKVQFELPHIEPKQVCEGLIKGIV